VVVVGPVVVGGAGRVGFEVVGVGLGTGRRLVGGAPAGVVAAGSVGVGAVASIEGLAGMRAAARGGWASARNQPVVTIMPTAASATTRVIRARVIGSLRGTIAPP
jgi:hypothetical protein